MSWQCKGQQNHGFWASFLVWKTIQYENIEQQPNYIDNKEDYQYCLSLLIAPLCLLDVSASKVLGNYGNKTITKWKYESLEGDMTYFQKENEWFCKFTFLILEISDL